MIIPFQNIICLLPVVVAVASQDQAAQCAIVNELVEIGEVTNAFHNIASFELCLVFLQTTTAVNICDIGDFAAYCPASCAALKANLPTRGGTFIRNKYRANIKVANTVDVAEMVKKESEFLNTDRLKNIEGERVSDYKNTDEWFPGKRIDINEGSNKCENCLEVDGDKKGEEGEENSWSKFLGWRI